VPPENHLAVLKLSVSRELLFKSKYDTVERIKKEQVLQLAI